jgi:hypothetical protein
MFTIVSHRAAAHSGKNGKVTCITCKLKKCVGRCRFEVVGGGGPRPKAS